MVDLPHGQEKETDLSYYKRVKLSTELVQLHTPTQMEILSVLYTWH